MTPEMMEAVAAQLEAMGEKELTADIEGSTPWRCEAGLLAPQIRSAAKFLFKPKEHWERARDAYVKSLKLYPTAVGRELWEPIANAAREGTVDEKELWLDAKTGVPLWVWGTCLYCKQSKPVNYVGFCLDCKDDPENDHT